MFLIFFVVFLVGDVFVHVFVAFFDSVVFFLFCFLFLLFDSPFGLVVVFLVASVVIYTVVFLVWGCSVNKDAVLIASLLMF